MNTPLLLHLTDLHVLADGRFAYDRVDTSACLRRAVARVLTLPQRPDACLITGDLSESGQPEDYTWLRALLAPLNMPLYLLPGNHDRRAPLRQAFADQPGMAADDPHAFIQYRLPLGDLQLIALDTTVPGADHGELCPARLDWLASQLQACEGQPVLIAMHHPPFRTGIAYMDGIGLRRGAPELQALVQRHGRVQHLLSGHVHRAISVPFGGSVASTIPSTAHQIALDLAPGATPAWTMEPPGFALHAWDGERLVSHLGTSAAFGGPYPFMP